MTKTTTSDDVNASNLSSPASYYSDGLSNRECIVCMSEVKDTIVLPCRHMCLCLECANVIRGKTDRCPLCRQGTTNESLLACVY